ncbi:Glycosyltransferase involved in cell wall bisynthesis [Burkholderiales bacterium 8X]|nr:Glycosyltransferase involved in cell wall bisynthesis [Burkholderiales bacterium 8X]
MSETRPRVALDMYVLAQAVKTGVYRVCDELYPRLASSPHLDARLFYREGDAQKSTAWLASRKLKTAAIEGAPRRKADVLLSPFGVAPEAWRKDPEVLKAHIVHDLIAINRPEYFSQEAADEVGQIIDLIDEHTTVFTVSENTRRELLAARPDLSPTQLTVMPLAAGAAFKPCTDQARMAAMRLKHGIPPGVPFVLSVATLEIRKNLDQVVNAFVLYLERHPASELVLVLAGMSGWKLEQLQEAVEAAGEARHRILLTGFVAEEDLSPLYSDAVCFVYLSRYEGFGLPPLEAMACGTPVICADNSSLPEVVGDAGLLFDADDVEGVADAIAEIASSPRRRQALAQAGLKRSALFSWDRSAELVAQTLSLAHARHQARAFNRRAESPTPSVLRTRYGVTRLPIQAHLLDYQNGSMGPVFDGMDGRSDAPSPKHAASKAPGWPWWMDALPAPPAAPLSDGTAARPEGGLRTRGIFKSGTASHPLVSYITVVRNNTQTLLRTLESVQRQSWDNVEHIVLDGASTDGTLALIEAHGDRLDYYASEPDKNLYDAINKAIPLARGQLICVLNSDDWLEPDAARIAAHRMQDRTEPSMLLTAAHVQAADFKHDWPPSLVHPGCFFMCANDCHNGIYVNRAAYERSGPYDISYKITADFKWIMTALEAGVRMVYTREPTVNYSLGGASGDVRQHSVECMRVVAERFPFLSSVEVSGLYHSFFQLAGKVAAQQPDRPDNLTEFVRIELARHADKPDFMHALTWAAMATFRHPEEVRAAAGASGPVPSFTRSAKDLVKSVLYKNPRLYRLGIASYQRLRK